MSEPAFEQADEPGIEQKPIEIPRPDRRVLELYLRGTSKLVVNRFHRKAQDQMLEQQLGKAKNKPGPRDPDKEYRMALYTFRGDPHRYGIRAVAFKKAAVNAIRQVKGITMTAGKMIFFVLPDGRDEDDIDVVEVHGTPEMRRDVVRLNNGKGPPQVRFRPEFKDWWVKLRIEYLATAITVEQLANIFNLAGFCSGVGENRPEKSGDLWGRWEVATEVPKNGRRSKRLA